MKKKIVLELGKANEIAKVMNCKRETVSRALNYKKHTLLAQKIRYVAVEQYGGVEVTFN